jgi:multiple antibiotic resistance protein
MTMQFSDLLVILFITAGATKAAAFFVAQTSVLTRAEKLTIAFRAITIQAVVLAIFARAGGEILHFFHVSVPALEVAGGLVLLLFALQLVLGEDHSEGHGPPPGISIAVYPLGMPLLASPQAIVAVTIASTQLGEGNRADLWLALAIVIAFNAVVLFGVALLGGKKEAATSGFSVAPVLLRVVGLLLCALAIEIMALGLRGYGILPPMPAASTVSAAQEAGTH